MSFEARIVASFGRQVRLRDAEGRLHDARPSGRRMGIVCGDFVRCERDERHDEVNVVEVLPRRTALYRSNLRAEAELLVANLSLLAIVVAPRPTPDWFVLDRYLCAAASAGIEAVIVLNKSELDCTELAAELAAYAAAGYEHVACSARERSGLDALRAHLRGKTAALVGQSGVGKSSLVTALVPDADAATGELASDDEGRHTTTAARLYDLPGGGELMDSPGVRDYAPAIDALDARSLGFVEVERLAPGCRFADCRHLREPKCAVIAASANGTMSPRRYESYRRLRRLHDDLVATRGPGRR